MLDYNTMGGAILLGCKKLLVKAHGSSKAVSIKACLYQIYDMHKADLTNIISEKIAKCGVVDE